MTISVSTLPKYWVVVAKNAARISAYIIAHEFVNKPLIFELVKFGNHFGSTHLEPTERLSLMSDNYYENQTLLCLYNRKYSRFYCGFTGDFGKSDRKIIPHEFLSLTAEIFRLSVEWVAAGVAS